MKEQLKAEAFVRDARPALMELSFGCRVKYGTSYTTVWQVLLAENSKEPNHYNTVDVRGVSNYLRGIQSSEIIGHPIALHHWLSVLGGRIYEILVHEGVAKVEVDRKQIGECFTYTRIFFNLTTGQPATEADYASFCDIMGI